MPKRKFEGMLIPSDLRDKVRKQADWQVWTMMNRAEPSARRQVTGRVEPMLQRVAQLLPFFGLFQPLLVKLPDEQVTISSQGGYRLQSTARPNPVARPSPTEVLTTLAPIFRRSVDQKLPITMELMCSGILAFTYVSHAAVLDPAFAIYLNDLQPFDLSPEEAFLARFSLIVDRLRIVGKPWGVETEDWSVMCYVGSNAIWRKGNRRGIWEDAVKGAQKEYRNGLTLKMYTDTPLGIDDFTIRNIIVQFHPPSYNLTGSHRDFL